jgi:hypothetical protein
MFAVSPGLHLRTYTQWHLIEVDPFTGKSQHALQIVNFGEEKTNDYENFEKGMIYMKILKKGGE